MKLTQEESQALIELCEEEINKNIGFWGYYVYELKEILDAIKTEKYLHDCVGDKTCNDVWFYKRRLDVLNDAVKEKIDELADKGGEIKLLNLFCKIERKIERELKKQ